jgi:hypothetical protein
MKQLPLVAPADEDGYACCAPAVTPVTRDATPLPLTSRKP